MREPAPSTLSLSMVMLYVIYYHLGIFFSLDKGNKTRKKNLRVVNDGSRMSSSRGALDSFGQVPCREGMTSVDPARAIYVLYVFSGCVLNKTEAAKRLLGRK